MPQLRSCPATTKTMLDQINKKNIKRKKYIAFPGIKKKVWLKKKYKIDKLLAILFKRRDKTQTSTVNESRDITTDKVQIKRIRGYD